MEPWKKNLAVIYLIQALGASTLTFVMSFIPLYVIQLGITDLHAAGVWSGFLMSTAAFFAFFSGPLWGNLADRYGRKLMVERVLFFNTIITTAMGFAGNIWVLFGLRSIQGVLGGFNSAITTLVTSLAPRHRIAFSLGLSQVAMKTGSTLGPIIGGLFADHLGYSYAFVAMGLITLAAFILSRLYVREDFQPKAKKAQESFWRSLQYLVRIKPLMALVTVNFLTQFTTMVMAVITPYFVRNLGADEAYLATISGTVIAANSVAGALGAVLIGRLADRHGAKGLLAGMTIASAISFFATIWVSTPWELSILRAINGFFLGGMAPTLNALIHAQIPAEKTGTAFGVTTSFFLLGNVLGPLVGGSLMDPLGFSGILILAGVIMAASTLWIHFAVHPAASKAPLR